MPIGNKLGPVVWLAVPVFAIDGILTLLGQPEGFWTDPRVVNEANHFFAWFLMRGHGLFVPLAAGYVLGAVALTHLLPRRLALACFLSFILGHYFGAASWMLWKFQTGPAIPILYGMLIATILAFSLHRDDPSVARAGEAGQSGCR